MNMIRRVERQPTASHHTPDPAVQRRVAVQRHRVELERQQELAYDTIQMFRHGYLIQGADRHQMVSALYHRIAQLVDAQNVCMDDGDGEPEPDPKTTEILQLYANTCHSVGIPAPV